MAGQSTTAVHRQVLLVSPRLSSFISACAREEALANAREQLVAHLAIGVEALLAAAFDGARVRSRPIFNIGAADASDFERTVMRFGRQRDDEVEIEPLPFVELFECHRLVP